MTAVACPNCSAEIDYDDLNSHLDQCLGLKDQKRSVPSTTFVTNGEGPAPPPIKRSKLTADDAKIVSYSSTSKAPASIPSSSRDRLDSVAPLAERLRPRSLEDFVGQDAVVNGPLKALVQRGSIPNAILWGPPGTGKTTLARILARTVRSGSGQTHRFVEISATTASTNDVKKVFDEAVSRLQLSGQRTVLFIDEIQRFSRAQQDIFLPVIEKGHCILLAATTENPSFRLQGALLSRMRVFVLTKLSIEECFQVLHRARQRVQQKEQEREGEAGNEDVHIVNVEKDVLVDDAVLRWIAEMADGDARTALSTLELALLTLHRDMSSEEKLTSLRANLKRTSLQYDRTGDHHYDTISALHKSIRGSNADAALYWLARMVESGDDPLFIARRLIVAASEDCNTLEALQMATATYSACQVVGLPECGENLAQCVVFLAESPKSTRAYRGWRKAQKLVRESYNYPVPIHIRNAPTTLMKQMGHGKEYRYEPSFAHPVHQEYFPPELRSTRLLSPPPSQRLSLSPSLSPSRDHSTEVEEIAEVPNGSNGAKSQSKPPHFLAKSSGIGPGSCQRIFQVGARSVDLDLLEEWERERNDGRPWSGRKELMREIDMASTSHQEEEPSSL